MNMELDGVERAWKKQEMLQSFGWLMWKETEWEINRC
jgi:hypothetical protein